MTEQKKWRIPRKFKKRSRQICYLGTMLDMEGPISWWIEHNQKCKKCRNNSIYLAWKWQHLKGYPDTSIPSYKNPKPPKQKTL